MKKMMKQFFVAVVALAAFTACSDSNYEGEGFETPSLFANQAMNTAILTDVNGQQLSSVSGDFGTYYLNIKTDGIWYIDTNDYMEFAPSRYYGRGSMRVPVMIGSNWAEARQLSYKVNFLDENGNDNMDEMVRENYLNIKNEIKQIVADELERISNDENLCHLLSKK